MSETLALVIVVAVLVAVVAGFLREKWSPDVVAGGGVAVLLAVGLLSPDEVLSVLSNPAPVTILCMFVLSAALERTGCVDALGNGLGRLVGNRPAVVLFGVMTLALVMSAFINNTPVAVILTPVAIALARRAGAAPSQMLIPLSYATILGGSLTMIGTSTNLLVDGVAREHGLAPFGMFEITLPALLIAGCAMSFIMIAAPRLLPHRETLSRMLRPDLARTFMTELLVPVDSPMAGKSISEAQLNGNSGLQVLRLQRGEQTVDRPTSDTRLEGGDRLLIHTSVRDVVDLRESGHLEFSRGRAFETLSMRDVLLVEAIVGRTSRYVDRPMRDLDLTARYGIAVLAVHRQDENIEADLDDFRLQFGDVMLVEGTATQIRRFADNGDLISLTGVEERAFRREKAPLAIAAVVLVTLLSALGVMPIEGVALIAVAAVLMTGCLEVDDAYRAIDWKILSLIFAMLAIGVAMDKVGLVGLIVEGIRLLAPGASPLLMLALVYLATSALTEALSNNAVAVLVTPVAIGLAEQLGVDVRPFVVAVMFAASASFATPIGYQTNTFVYNAGGYRFTDFMRLGVPLNLLTAAIAVLVIPVFWPF